MTSNNQKLNIKGLALLLGLFILSFNIFAKVPRIGIIDTGFCLKEAFDATKSLKSPCNEKVPNSFRNHGQWIIQELNNKKNLFPVIVFDKEGIQKKEYWQKAFKYLKKNKVEIVLLASSFPLKSTKVNMPTLPTDMLFFIASGQSGNSISKKTKLWPHEILPKQNAILIGSYFQEEDTFIENPRSLYKEKIDYYFSGESKNNLKESSLAVTWALKKALDICPIKNMMNCIKKNAKNLKLKESPRGFRTF